MSPASEPRIGDVERDAAIKALGEHYAAGRLTKDEYDERADVALRARFDSELRPLFLYLPRTVPGQPPPPWPQYRPPSRRGPSWRESPLLPLLFVLAVVVAVANGAWWLLFVLWFFFWCRPHRRWH
jgi:hypothetical protein